MTPAEIVGRCIATAVAYAWCLTVEAIAGYVEEQCVIDAVGAEQVA